VKAAAAVQRLGRTVAAHHGELQDVGGPVAGPPFHRPDQRVAHAPAAGGRVDPHRDQLHHAGLVARCTAGHAIGRVEAIQSDTASAIEAIEQIAGIVGRINEYQTVIAAAVEEQTATTAEMGRNVEQAAAGTHQIASTIAGVARATATTTDGVSQSQQAAAELAQMSGELHALCARFRLA